MVNMSYPSLKIKCSVKVTPTGLMMVDCDRGTFLPQRKDMVNIEAANNRDKGTGEFEAHRDKSSKGTDREAGKSTRNTETCRERGTGIMLTKLDGNGYRQ